MRFSLLKTVFCIICVAVMMKMTPVLGLENGYSRIVYGVSGVQNYSLHWNDRFPPGSELKIYVEANGINHRRAVGVDYIFIIRDPNNNIVNTELFENRYRSYRENDFVILNRTITEDWEDGFYTAQIHIYDLLSDSIMEDYYNNVTKTLVDETGNDTLPDIPYMNRGNIRNDSNLDQRQHKVIIQKFWIDRYADKYPVNRFTIKDITFDKSKIAPGEDVGISVNIENNFYDDGIVTFDILMDGQRIDTVSTDMGPFSSKNINFNVSSNITGIHEIDIVPTSRNTIGHDLLASVYISEQEITTPTTFSYKDIAINNLTIEPNQTVIVTVTIENRGKAGLLPMTITVNDVPEIQEDVYLNFLETKDIKFNITKSDIGQYRVTVNNTDLSKIFFVKGEEEKKETMEEKKDDTKEKEIPKIYTIFGLLIAIISIFVLRRHLINKWG